MLFRSVALLAAATIVAGQTIDSLDPCGQTCYANVKNNAGQFGCGADDMACLCAVPDFKNGIEDCAKGACPPDYSGVVLGAINALCATAAPAAPTPEPTTSSAAPPAPSSTTPPPAPESTSTTPVPSPSSTSEAPAAVSSEPSATTSLTPETSATVIPSTTSSSDVAGAKPTASSTSSNSEAEPSSSPKSEDTEPAGLTVGAKAGIGIGVGAAAIALLGVAAWMITRQRRNKRANGFSSKHMIKISDSTPGGGRGFANDHHYETGLSDLEMKSRRYEDMIPRQQPRHMV